MPSIRQLLLISSLVIACILVAMLAMATGSLQRQLEAQLQADGENAASTLALLVAAQSTDAARAQALDAVFQQGSLAALVLQRRGDSAVFTKKRSVRAPEPAWFRYFAEIESPAARRLIDGAGELSLVPDSSAARGVLWAYFVYWSWLLLALAAFWALFVLALLARARRALAEPASPEIKFKQSEAAAEDAELLDDVRERVAPSVDEQMARIERLELELNRDPGTGLANRAYFLNELKRMLRDDSRQGAVSGYVFLVRQRDMARMQNQADQYEIDDWLRVLGRRVRELLAEYPASRSLPARLNGADFVVLFACGGGTEVMRPIQRLQELFETLRVKLDSHNLSRWAFALTDYTVNCNTKDILTRLDQALMYAESAGHEEIEFLSYTERHDDELRMGEASWRTLISQALDQDRLSLDIRRVEYQGDDLESRHEAALLLQEEDSPQAALSGYLFMPAATRLGLSSACDMRALCLALGWLGENSGVLVIRMSVASILDPQYLEEIRQICARADSALLQRLVIELDAYGLSRHLESFRIFAQGVRDCGMAIGLRGLDQQPDALRQIHEVDFSYVKLAGNFVRELLASPGGVQMMVAVTETAIGMGMRVYVEDAEDADIRQMVLEYGALPRI